MTSGDPNFHSSKRIINSLPKFGADFIEIGIPFSDPMADGPTIQKSSQRAIKSGINLKKTFQIVKNFRENDQITPIILMGVFQSNFSIWPENFFQTSSTVGVDGLIIVDLPPEEDDLIKKLYKKI